jgi:hypothetical protein
LALQNDWGVGRVGTVQTADARFLRRIMLVLVLLTVGTGAMAGVATVNAMAAQGVDICGATGFLCKN